MSEQKSDYQFPNHHDRYTTEQPIEPQLYRPLIQPNPFDPIGNIETEGQAFRTLASGRIPRWVLLTSWVVFGGVSFLTLGATFKMLADEFQRAIATDRLGSFGFLAIPSLMGIFLCLLMLTILVRATWRKR
jgi:hypothetical protein